MRRIKNFRRWSRLPAMLGFGLLLGACWPGTETYFSPSAPGGKVGTVCGFDGYEIAFQSPAYDWVQIYLQPVHYGSNGLHLNFGVKDDIRQLYRNADAAVVGIQDSNRRWTERNAHALRHQVRYMDVVIKGTMVVTWKSGRTELPVDGQFRSHIPDFQGNYADILLPPVSINGAVQQIPPIHLERTAGVKMRGINGC